MLGIIGKKVGMTQVYDKDGAVIPVTVVYVHPNLVVGLKTVESHGYNSVLLAQGEQKEQRMGKAELGVFKKLKAAPRSKIKEFRTDRSKDFAPGSELTVASLNVGDIVDVEGVSKGKGFQGVMKRHHFGGGHATHGCSVSHRNAGSVGNNTFPARVIPNKKMAGQMGNATATVKNLRIIGVEAEQGLILIKGALPGGKNTRVVIYPHAAEFETRALTAKSVGSNAAEAQAVQA